MAAGAVSLRKSHDIVILSFCDIVKGQANYLYVYALLYFDDFYLNYFACFLLLSKLTIQMILIGW